MTMPAVTQLSPERRVAPLLSMKGVRKTFARGFARSAGRTIALWNVDLDLHSGEVLGISGIEGAGKSALLQCAGGLLRRDSGDIRWFGESFDGGGLFPEVAYVPAVPVFYPFLTVRDVLELRAARAIPTCDDCTVIEQSLASLGLGPHAERPVMYLARDEVKRLAVAEALVTRPRALLIDTVPGVLSPPVSLETCFALGDYAVRGGAVMIATRDLSSVAALVTRCVLLTEGSVSSEDPWSHADHQRLSSPQGSARFVAETLH